MLTLPNTKRVLVLASPLLVSALLFSPKVLGFGLALDSDETTSETTIQFSSSAATDKITCYQVINGAKKDKFKIHGRAHAEPVNVLALQDTSSSAAYLFVCSVPGVSCNTANAGCQVIEQ